MKKTYELHRTFEETYSRYPFAPLVRLAVMCARFAVRLRRSRREGNWRKKAAVDGPAPDGDMRVVQ